MDSNQFRDKTALYQKEIRDLKVNLMRSENNQQELNNHIQKLLQ
jgi:hypothetical protein